MRTLTEQLESLYLQASQVSAKMFQVSEHPELNEKEREKLQAMGETLGGYLSTITHVRWKHETKQRKPRAR